MLNFIANILASSLPEIKKSIKITINGKGVPDSFAKWPKKSERSIFLIKSLLIAFREAIYKDKNLDEVTKIENIFKSSSYTTAEDFAGVNPYRQGLLVEHRKEIIPLYLLTKESASLVSLPIYTHFTKLAVLSKEHWVFLAEMRDRWDSADFIVSDRSIEGRFNITFNLDMVEKATGTRAKEVAKLSVQAKLSVRLNDGSIGISTERRIILPEKPILNKEQAKVLQSTVDSPIMLE